MFPEQVRLGPKDGGSSAASALCRWSLTAALGLACLGCSRADHAIAFRGVNVFDGEHTRPAQTVIVEDGKIAAVGSDLAVPAGAEVIDGAGKTLLPGLINAHVHTLNAGQLSEHLIFGVTTVLDMFAELNTVRELKRAQAEHRAGDRADLFSAGTLITAPGGHGTEYGFKVPTLSGPADAQAFVDARLAEGSDYIKLIYDDHTALGLPRMPTLSKDTLAAAIAAAHRRKKLAVVHIVSLAAAREAIEAGADGLAHLFVGAETAPDFGELAARHHAFVIPTLTVLYGFCGERRGQPPATDAKLSRYLTPQDLQTLNNSFPNHGDVQCAGARQAVAQLKAARVPILAGDDVPNPGTAPGATLHRELELLVDAGLTPAEALAAATSVPARVFHLADRGAIAPGKRADLLLVDGDPTKNILATRDIAGVWKAGVSVNRQAYLERNYVERAKGTTASNTPSGAANGLVSDFEQPSPAARFGAGWVISTDALRGGTSTAQMRIAPGGAQGSRGALRVDGEVQGAFPQWAGVMFAPGAAVMMPANLAGKKEISFWAKGDNRSFEVSVFAQRFGQQPLIQMFDVRPEWRQFHFALKSFNGFDGAGMMGLFIGAGPPGGKFTLYIDDVRID